MPSPDRLEPSPDVSCHPHAPLAETSFRPNEMTAPGDVTALPSVEVRRHAVASMLMTPSAFRLKRSSHAEIANPLSSGPLYPHQTGHAVRRPLCRRTARKPAPGYASRVLPHEAPAEVNLRDYLQVLRRRRSIVAVAVAVVLGVALAVSYLQTPRYAATAKLLLRQQSAESLFSTRSVTNINPVRAVETEIEVIKTEPVKDLVRQKIGDAPSVTVDAVGETDLITIRAESTTAARAPVVANAYANAYIDFRRKQAFDEFAAASEEVQTKIADIQLQIDSLSSTTANLPPCVDARTTPDACTQRAAELADQPAGALPATSRPAPGRQRIGPRQRATGHAGVDA